MTASIKQSQENKMLAEIFLLDIIFDFSKNNDKKYAEHKLIAIRDYPFFRYESKKIKSALKLVAKKNNELRLYRSKFERRNKRKIFRN